MNSNKFKIISFFILVLSTLNTLSSYAQGAGLGISGIYMNSREYSAGKLSLSFSCNSSAKIKLHHTFAGKYAEVINGGMKTRLYKDSIFGYHNSDNEDYRFYKSYDEEFRILESKGIVIYSSYVRASSPTGKKNDLALTYYFSKTIDSEILPLTVWNLKRAFPGNIKLHELLDLEFGSGKPLSTYLAKDKIYLINYLLNKS